jgi:hypothetical protein
MRGEISQETLVFSPVEPPAVIVRRKTRRISLRLDAKNGLRISAPPSATKQQIANFITANNDWLMRQRQRSQTAFTPLAGDSLGQRLPVVHHHGPSLAAKLKRGELILTHPADFEDWEGLFAVARPSIKRWFTQKARAELLAQAGELANEYGFKPLDIKSRWMRSRWGSCHQRGTITLNTQLVRVPDYLQRYVILHELTHLKQPHHQSAFWRELEFLTGPAKPLRRELKSHQLWY